MILRHFVVWVLSVISFYGIIGILDDIKGVKTDGGLLAFVVLVSSVIYWFAVISVLSRFYDVEKPAKR